jgi:hypothetical protein
MRATVPSVWIRWLVFASAGVVLFGLLLVVAPSWARQGFALLIYGAPGALDAFGSEPARYASLAHAVMGALMIGWGAALWLITRELLARGSRLGWRLIAGSLAAWFVPDTAYSLLSGYWQNAVLNAVFLTLFAIPLAAIRRHLEPAG